MRSVLISLLPRCVCCTWTYKCVVKLQFGTYICTLYLYITYLYVGKGAVCFSNVFFISSIFPVLFQHQLKNHTTTINPLAMCCLLHFLYARGEQRKPSHRRVHLCYVVVHNELCYGFPQCRRPTHMRALSTHTYIFCRQRKFWTSC